MRELAKQRRGASRPLFAGLLAGTPAALLLALGGPAMASGVIIGKGNTNTSATGLAALDKLDIETSLDSPEKCKEGARTCACIRDLCQPQTTAGCTEKLASCREQLLEQCGVRFLVGVDLEAGRRARGLDPDISIAGVAIGREAMIYFASALFVLVTLISVRPRSNRRRQRRRNTRSACLGARQSTPAQYRLGDQNS